MKKNKNIDKSSKSDKFLFKILIILLFLIVAMLSYYLIRLINSNVPENTGDDISAQQTPEETSEEPQLPTLPDKIDFQTVVDEWSGQTSGKHSVLIYDIERDEIVGKDNPDATFSTASLYKLFVVYEGYRRIMSKEYDPDSKIGSTGRTLIECLDLAIRESNSTCAETIWQMIGHSELDSIIAKDFGIKNSNISSLQSTPSDILKIMKLFYEHSDIKDENLIAKMKDSFLNQPTTNYNWRQGLPSGFKVANVYNKVGWDYNGKYWNLYHDAAIVEFPEDDRHFIVVVMTSQVPYQKIRSLGEMIENQYVLKN